MSWGVMNEDILLLQWTMKVMSLALIQTSWIIIKKTLSKIIWIYPVTCPFIFKLCKKFPFLSSCGNPISLFLIFMSVFKLKISTLLSVDWFFRNKIQVRLLQQFLKSWNHRHPFLHKKLFCLNLIHLHALF